MFLKKLAALTAMTLVGAVALAAPAQADDTMGVAACTLIPGSVAGISNPGVESVLTDGVATLLDTDSGTFSFSGQAVCAGADVASSGGGVAPSLAAGVYNINTTSGTYNNLICGTGTANGTATLTNAPGTPAATINTTFAITFAAGVGKLSIVVNSGSIDGLVGPNGNTISGGEGTGVISILPTQSTPPGSVGCINGDVTGFLVNGAFETTLSG